MSKRILIVDDSAAVRKSLRTLLEVEVEASCDEASDGRQAVTRAREWRPDLIVLDLSMPVMNGLDAAPQLKNLLPSSPIVMFTSFDDDQVRGMAASAGVQAVVNKATPGQLVSAVRSLLS